MTRRARKDAAREVVAPAPRAARLRWRIVTGIGSVLAAIGVGEIGSRVLNLGPPVYAERRTEPNGKVPFATTADGIVLYQPHSTFSHVYDPAGDDRGYFGSTGRVTYDMNDYGLRGPAVAVDKPAGTYRVVCLGDSFTFGEGVRREDTMAVQLERRLAAAWPTRAVEVINAGVQGYDTSYAGALYLTQLRRFGADVVVLGFFLNDATDPGETIEQHEAMTRAVDLSALGRVSRIWEIVERGRRGRALQAEYFRTTRAGFDTSRWTQCQTVMEELRRLGEKDGYEFVVMIWPILYQLDATYPFADLHERVASAATVAGCEVIDLLDVFRGMPAESLWVHPTDQHPNEKAHTLAAARLAQFLVERKADE